MEYDYADDGIPLYYYKTINNAFAMDDMKEAVFAVLETIKENHETDPTEPTLDDVENEEICERANINKMFAGDIAKFVVDWMEKENKISN